MPSSIKLLEVRDLSVTFSVRGAPLRAVRGVSFAVEEGETVGIVGESGSGKSALVQAITRLIPAQIEGTVLFRGKPTIHLGKEIGMIFQDPASSLNPTMQIGAQISEGLLFHRLAKKQEAHARAAQLLELVGIQDAESKIKHYPHQFSGGMRQRVLIAIAIACNPSLLIADEPTTALDTKTKGQILELIKEMQKRLKMGLLLISHDFDVIARVCEKVLVMYAGKIVESGPVEKVLQRPEHPYTQMLLGALPQEGQSRTKPLQAIEGIPPNLMNPIQGCAFRPRCPLAALKCEREPEGRVACWRVEPLG